ncbi:hypothetical protein [Streptomyces sp. URMC 123]|uniref:hypothetical protein n=1 Tax=Streptomyces sp. URMC 123 TaxID=3423403 RepID=UPI003F1BDD9F
MTTTPLLLTDIETAVRRGWSADTCTPEYRSHWTPPVLGRLREEYELLRDRVRDALREPALLRA